MKFFNIDLHVSVIADITAIFNNLGHEVTSWSLSLHAPLFGKEIMRPDIIHRDNWYYINQDMCDYFYENYKEAFDCYDGFIVTHTPVFSMLYEKFNKPIITVASTRYEAPYTLNAAEWERLNEYLQTNRNIIPVANNLYDQWRCGQYTGRNWKYIPSLCHYADGKWTGSKGYGVFDHGRSRYVMPMDCADRLADKSDIHRPYTWQELADYTCYVCIPYNVSTMTLFELYWMGVPIVVPSYELALKMWPDILQEMSYAQLLGREFPLPPEAQLKMSDFWQWPAVTTFDSFDDLSGVLRVMNMKEISEDMSHFNKSRRTYVYSAWKSILEGISA